MWAILVKGGFIMYPLTLLSILGLGVVIEKIINLRTPKVLQREIINCVESVKTAADIPMAIQICERYNTPFANVIQTGLEEATSGLTVVRQAMEDTGRREVKRLSRYLVVLETVAAASPLLGLLGTVFGGTIVGRYRRGAHYDGVRSVDRDPGAHRVQLFRLAGGQFCHQDRSVCPPAS